MIEINLLPEIYRVSQKKTTQTIPVDMIMLSIAAILIVILLITSGLNLSRSMKLSALNKRLEGLVPEQQKLNSLRQKMSNFSNTNAMFAPFVTNRLIWAKKLNALSDALIPGVWLRSFSLQKKTTDPVLNPPALYTPGVFQIEGTVVSVASDEMSVIGDFVRGLKINEDFMSDFKDIELEGVLRRRIAEVEVMDFTLICTLKAEVKI